MELPNGAYRKICFRSCLTKCGLCLCFKNVSTAVKEDNQTLVIIFPQP